MNETELQSILQRWAFQEFDEICNEEWTVELVHDLQTVATQLQEVWKENKRLRDIHGLDKACLIGGHQCCEAPCDVMTDIHEARRLLRELACWGNCNGCLGPCMLREPAKCEARKWLGDNEDS